MRDLLARWAEGDADQPDGAPLPVVYPDNVMPALFGALESLSVVASESMQHQTFAEIVRSVAVTFERLPGKHRHDAASLILRSLAGMGDHMLTTELERALDDVRNVIEASGCRPSGAIRAGTA